MASLRAPHRDGVDPVYKFEADHVPQHVIGNVKMTNSRRTSKVLYGGNESRALSFQMPRTTAAYISSQLEKVE